VSDKFLFGVVADGVGGEPNASESSQKAVRFLSDKLSVSTELNPDLAKTLIRKSILDTSREIFHECHGFTTVVAVKICQFTHELYAVGGSVGDSRLYLYRNNALIQISRDDSSIPSEMLPRISDVTVADELDEFELSCFRERHLMTQAMGQEYPPDVHLYSFLLQPNDLLILTSDGIHDNLTYSEIQKVIISGEKIAEKLVDTANNRAKEGVFRSKPDDLSAVVFSIRC
jgi:PPM family protein phosphatase